MDYARYGENSAGDLNGYRFAKSFASLLPLDGSPYCVLDCCNGLILYYSKSVPGYYVCNPATKQCIALPKPSADLSLYNAALAFNPCESSHYKVIRFIYSHSFSASDSPELEIFSSETRNWTRHDLVVEPPSAHAVLWVKRTVYLDGILYKLTLSKYLLRFDLKTLKAQAIELPCKDKTDECGSFSVSKGCLFYANHNGPGISIWQFDYGSKSGGFWILKHWIRVYDLLVNDSAGRYGHMVGSSSHFKLYAIHPTSDIIYLGIPDTVLSYHVGTGKLEYFYRRHSTGEIASGHVVFYPYTRCFTLLNDASQTDNKFS